MSIYLTLFWEFFKTGLFAVGGGMATIPFLSDMADKYPWLTQAQLTDMIAVSESTPGPIGVNCATYAGFNAAGIPGALVASISEILPSFIIILLISKAIEKYRENAYVQSAFGALRPTSTGLISAAAWGVIAKVLFSFSSYARGNLLSALKPAEILLFAALMVLTNIKKIKELHPVCFIGLAALCGIIFKL